MSFGDDIGDAIVGGFAMAIIIALCLGAAAMKGCEYFYDHGSVSIKVKP